MQKSSKTSIWQQCRGETHLATIKQHAWRTVEAQHLSSTRKLVDNLTEHRLLEELIEETKPALNSAEFQSLHYLLATPFRYPPLPYGSRFGRRNERGLWYGSNERNTTFAESAYYRLVFLRSCEFDLALSEILLTSFKTKIRSARAIDLTIPPFSRYKKGISSPVSYHQSQTLGFEMREADVEIAIYTSARDHLARNNLVVFSPRAFASHQPEANSFETWVCRADKDNVEFMRTSSLENEMYRYESKSFLVNNEWPDPSN